MKLPSGSAGFCARLGQFHRRIGGAVMKLVGAIKRKLGVEKSLKSYAWYIWY
ncbi:hypothetical protein SCATT_43690 [Streptantibioticus cattleyicolor NRRL 8057 = DSM 46488]|uniref:Uncharacterized protein n=1 Tax=Streptantibioticus cattleyicolor (strain ATCC 35852 / DSM 46488 / JCM 4925 / NBRC 14057 / NRRL 8057) TaxID=1003195 RepID=G8WUX6_STREN|nr:hypothetical protein SCATT_43690 [Streptantibioticus cattleyicolor NRRL 8057 = DSM 46488]